MDVLVKKLWCRRPAHECSDSRSLHPSTVLVKIPSFPNMHKFTRNFPDRS